MAFSAETNDTSKERSDNQLLAAEKTKGLALSEGLPAYLQQKNIEKKRKFAGANSGSKKKCLIAPILCLYYELIVCPLLLNYNKVHFWSSLNCQTYCVRHKIK